ncbi:MULTISPECIES: HlyD family secretion protein [Candidatus Brocadia]|uniref:HlyD family secretion protein n=1 Tax=Candidatus Brocadia TaxID=380240 RepID=UPI0021BBF0E2|nr:MULTISPECIES: efflux RND transporter periplasmic adaptor subunit [Brocadia]
MLTVIKGSRSVPPSPPVVDPSAPPFGSSVAGAGIVEANTENIAIGTLIPGVVSEIYVSVGGRVNARDPLFKIDDRDLKAQLAIRQTALRVAKAKVSVEKAQLDDLKDQLAKAEILSYKKVISVDELDRRRYAVQTAEAKLAQARAEVASAKAQVNETETNLDRVIVRAPCNGKILQSKIHPGEFAPAGITQTPLMLFGSTEPLNVRVDVDENDAWRVYPDAPAVAFLRGNREIKTPLKFVRFEPYVVPKKSLTGDSTERVDTRVLQVIYRVEHNDLPIFAGQQMDVFIEAADQITP